jgi:hypothetical protein
LNTDVDFGGPTTQLTAGVYTWGTAVNIHGNLHFDGQGDSDAVFIIQITGDLVVAGGKKILLSATPCPPTSSGRWPDPSPPRPALTWRGFSWSRPVKFITGSSLNGRILTQTRCDLQKATVTAPATSSETPNMAGGTANTIDDEHAHKDSNEEAIIIGVVVGVVCLGAIVASALFYVKYRREQEARNTLPMTNIADAGITVNKA